MEDFADWDTETRYSGLCDARLVCQSWSVQARVVLWRKVKVVHNGVARRLLSSPALGRYQTKDLIIVGGMRASLYSIEIIARLRGFVKLTLLHFGISNQVDSAILSSPSLEGVFKLLLL